ncbi:Na+/H+ antiporter subunit E [Oceanobacillus sp. CAU 1775]
MAFQTLINLLIAILWMFLNSSFTVGSFIFGYLIGIFLLFVLRYFFEFDFYMRRVWAFIKLCILFAVELTKANVDMVRVVMRPKLNHKPGIIAVETRLKTELEISLLAALISLTPGTIAMDFSDDNKTLYIHAIDVDDEEEFRDDIQNSFERAILEVTE